MQLHMVNFDTLHPIQTPVNLVVPWKVEECREESPKAFVDIYGDLVGICVHECSSRSHLRVYNWKSGSQLLVSIFDSPHCVLPNKRRVESHLQSR